MNDALYSNPDYVWNVLDERNAQTQGIQRALLEGDAYAVEINSLRAKRTVEELGKQAKKKLAKIKKENRTQKKKGQRLNDEITKILEKNPDVTSEEVLELLKNTTITEKEIILKRLLNPALDLPAQAQVVAEFNAGVNPVPETAEAPEEAPPEEAPGAPPEEAPGAPELHPDPEVREWLEQIDNLRREIIGILKGDRPPGTDIVPLRNVHKLSLRIQKLRAKITERTGMIFINDPLPDAFMALHPDDLNRVIRTGELSFKHDDILELMDILKPSIDEMERLIDSFAVGGYIADESEDPEEAEAIRDAVAESQREFDDDDDDEVGAAPPAEPEVPAPAPPESSEFLNKLEADTLTKEDIAEGLDKDMLTQLKGMDLATKVRLVGTLVKLGIKLKRVTARFFTDEELIEQISQAILEDAINVGLVPDKQLVMVIDIAEGSGLQKGGEISDSMSTDTDELMPEDRIPKYLHRINELEADIEGVEEQLEHPMSVPESARLYALIERYEEQIARLRQIIAEIEQEEQEGGQMDDDPMEVDLTIEYLEFLLANDINKFHDIHDQGLFTDEMIEHFAEQLAVPPPPEDPPTPEVPSSEEEEMDTDGEPEQQGGNSFEEYQRLTLRRQRLQEQHTLALREFTPQNEAAARVRAHLAQIGELINNEGASQADRERFMRDVDNFNEQNVQLQELGVIINNLADEINAIDARMVVLERDLSRQSGGAKAQQEPPEEKAGVFFRTPKIQIGNDLFVDKKKLMKKNVLSIVNSQNRKILGLNNMKVGDDFKKLLLKQNIRTKNLKFSPAEIKMYNKLVEHADINIPQSKKKIINAFSNMDDMMNRFKVLHAQLGAGNDSVAAINEMSSIVSVLEKNGSITPELAKEFHDEFIM